MPQASLLSPPRPEHRIAKLPSDYTIGVRCTTFAGMLMYHGRPFIMWGCFMKWSEIETYSLRQLLLAMQNGDVFYARKKAPVIKRRRKHGAK